MVSRCVIECGPSSVRSELCEEFERHIFEFYFSLFILDVLKKDDVKQLVSIDPEATLFDAIRSLIENKIHRLPVIDPETGNVLYILTHKRLLRFLFLYVS